MPLIRMKTASAGPNGNRDAGGVYPVTPDEGWELVRGGFAEWVDPPAQNARPVELAVLPKARNAAKRTKKG
jgi:hypothetical protein